MVPDASLSATLFYLVFINIPNDSLVHDLYAIDLDFATSLLRYVLRLAFIVGWLLAVRYAFEWELKLDT